MSPRGPRPARSPKSSPVAAATACPTALIRGCGKHGAAPRGNCKASQGLQDDHAAVQAAVALDWSNGQVEGQTNRLKTLKRQMYGRANLDLLGQRFLLAA